MENEEPSLLPAPRRRRWVAWERGRIVVAESLCLAITSTAAYAFHERPEALDYKIVALVQAGLLITVTLFLSCTSFVHLCFLQNYCLLSVLRLVAVFFLFLYSFPSSEYVWFLSPLALLATVIFAGSILYRAKRGEFNAYPTYADHCAARRTDSFFSDYPPQRLCLPSLCRRASSDDLPIVPIEHSAPIDDSYG